MADFGPHVRHEIRVPTMLCFPSQELPPLAPLPPSSLLKFFVELQKGCFFGIIFFLFWFQFQIKHKYLQERDARKKNMKIKCACAEYHDFRERKASVRRNIK